MSQDNIKEFVAEAEEIIDSISQCLIELDENEISAPKPEIINTIFRSAHTLKGMSGMVGYQTIAELSHKLEDLLDELRMGRMEPTREMLDVLFQGLDLLRELVTQVSTSGSDNCDISSVLELIKELKEGESSEEVDPLAEAGFDPEILKVLTEYETHRLSVAIKSSSNMFEIKTSYPLDSFDTDLATTNEVISSKCEIVATLPDMELSADSTEMSFSLIVSTTSTLEEVITLTEGIVKGVTTIDYNVKKKDKQLKKVAPSSANKESPPAEQASIKSISSTLRVEIESLDSLLNIVGELVLAKAIVNGIAKDLLQELGLTDTIIELQKSTLSLDRRVSELQEGLISIRMVPISQLFDRLARVVRKSAKAVDKDINLQISGEETKLDKSMIEDIADPLMHLIRNSIDHGVELADIREDRGKSRVGTVMLSASQKGSSVVLEVEDDGGGINVGIIKQKAVEKGLLEEAKEYSPRDIMNQMFQPGFSTAKQVTELSGRGVGLDVVAKNVTKLGGRVEVDSELEKWTRFTISLPITLIIIKALIVSTAAEIFALPLNSVSESLIIEPGDVYTIETREVIRLREQTLPLISLAEIFKLPNQMPSLGGSKYVVVVGIAEKRVGIVVDSIAGQQEIVIKSTGDLLESVPGIAGATELGNQKTILVLDIPALIQEATV